MPPVAFSGAVAQSSFFFQTLISRPFFFFFAAPSSSLRERGRVLLHAELAAFSRVGTT